MAPSIGEAAQHLLESWSRDDWHAAAKSVTVRRIKPALIFGLAFWAMRKVAELAQHYYKKRKPPPRKPQPEKKQGWGSIVALLGVLATIALGVQAWCYHRYGPLFFWSAESKQLDLTPHAWRALLETRSVGFIGGHHRAGTTQLWRSVARHPEVASFGEQRDCGLDFSEGIFAQDVYPRFGVGDVQDFLGSQKNTGLGRYALGAVEDVYWTEGHFTVSGHAQARVLNRFGFLWDRHSGLDKAKVLLEKSPPNAVLARYLQALVDWPDHVRAPEKTCAADAEFCDVAPPPAPLSSRARFIFVTRHPIANAVSHLAYMKDGTIPELVAHWVAVEAYMRSNAPRLAHVRKVKFEDFCAAPSASLLDLWTFLGVEADLAAAAAATADVRRDPNKIHRETYCAPVRAGNPSAAAAHALLADRFAGVIEDAHGYAVRDWCSVDE